MPVHPPLVLLTRPKEAAERFAATLTDVEVVIAPLMAIVGTDASVSLDGIAGLVLTSENAIRFVPAADLPAYCVGQRTTEVARKTGFRASDMGGQADALVNALLRCFPSGPLLHPHGVHVRGDVANRLSQAGIETRGVAVYDQVELDVSDQFKETLRRPNLRVPLFSPRSARLFVANSDQLRDDTRLIAFSPAVAAELPRNWHPQTEILSEPNADEMRLALQRAEMRRISP